MIIKSHIRAGYRAAADYLKEQGKNEYIRLVEISDPDASNLDQAFHNMWVIASATKARKPLHHISINPFKDERLTDQQVQLIVERCEQRYGYKSGDHQRVIVEHIKDGRQHFHVMWNRVSLRTGKAVWPGHHWLKSKQVCREMEVELGLKRPISRTTKYLKVCGP
ncbi:MAG: relaxase/mobilization nuclease domain-containing protein [Alphaproteobacteria bacterium]